VLAADRMSREAVVSSESEERQRHAELFGINNDLIAH